MNSYAYTVSGTAAGGQTWTVKGTANGVQGDFPHIVSGVLRELFGKLTSGKAVYGKPGVGCNGPYQITKLVIERSAAP